MCGRVLSQRNLQARLVFQRHHGLIAAAEGCHMLETAVRLFQQHNRTVAEYRMTVLGHVPRTALPRLMRHGAIDRRTRWCRNLGTGQRQRQ